MSTERMEIIFAGVNDIVPGPPTKERVWAHIQELKRHAEAQGMVVGIHESLIAEYAPVATQPKEQ